MLYYGYHMIGQLMILFSVRTERNRLMTRDALMKTLHDYTPWELLHRNRRQDAWNMEPVNQTLEVPVTDAEKNTGLHLPQVPDLDDNTFSSDIYFRHAPGQNYMIVQHDRYTPGSMHRHNFFELQVCVEGEFMQQINSKRLLMHSGDFCLIPPMVSHLVDVQNYTVLVNLLIPEKHFKNICLSQLHGDNVLSRIFMGNVYYNSVNDYVIFHTNGNPAIMDLVLSICQESLEKKPYYVYMMDTELLLLLGVLIRNYESTCELPQIHRKQDGINYGILQYIEENFRHISLQELSDKFHYTPQHMSALLKELTGYNFSGYILEKRMQAAEDYLLHTTLKIKDISIACGYQNQEHFIRTFRKYYGTTPIDYRNQHSHSA